MRGKKGGKKIWSINLLIEIEVLKELKESLYFEILLLKCGCLVHVKEDFMKIRIRKLNWMHTF